MTGIDFSEIFDEQITAEDYALVNRLGFEDSELDGYVESLADAVNEIEIPF